MEIYKLSFDHLSNIDNSTNQPSPLPCAVPFRESHGGPWGWNIGCCTLCRYQRATCGATCQPTSLSMPARLDRDPCFYRDFVIYISLRLPITNRDPCLLLRAGTSRYRATIPFHRPSWSPPSLYRSVSLSTVANFFSTNYGTCINNWTIVGFRKSKIN